MDREDEPVFEPQPPEQEPAHSALDSRKVVDEAIERTKHAVAEWTRDWTPEHDRE
jgi:hypothetical protein